MTFIIRSNLLFRRAVAPLSFVLALTKSNALDVIKKTLNQRCDMDTALLLKALGDPTRFMIFQQILSRKHCVRSLSKKLGISKSAVSQHMKILREAGLVYGERFGSSQPGCAGFSVRRICKNEGSILPALQRTRGMQLRIQRKENRI